jgi:hypothetical protein
MGGDKPFLLKGDAFATIHNSLREMQNKTRIREL